MKLDKSEIANIPKEILTEKQAAGIAYQLRTECRHDCEVIRAILRPWLVSWKETSGYTADDSHVGADGVMWASMNWAVDTDVQLIIGNGGPCLNEIRWLIDKLSDCHVAAQSVNKRELYTGDRIDYMVLRSIKTPPSTAMINMAMKTLLQRIELSEITIEAAQDAWNELSTVRN